MRSYTLSRKSRIAFATLLFALATSAHAALDPQRGTDLSRWVPHRYVHAREAFVSVIFIEPWFLGRYDVRTNAIYVQPFADSYTLAHEVGHAIWHKDLSVREKFQWWMLHRSNPYLLAVLEYPNDPRHSFAEAFAQFTCRPAPLKRDFPEIYDWFCRLEKR